MKLLCTWFTLTAFVHFSSHTASMSKIYSTICWSSTKSVVASRWPRRPSLPRHLSTTAATLYMTCLLRTDVSATINDGKYFLLCWWQSGLMITSSSSSSSWRVGSRGRSDDPPWPRFSALFHCCLSASGVPSPIWCVHVWRGRPGALLYWPQWP